MPEKEELEDNTKVTDDGGSETTPKTFTQEEVGRVIAKEKAKYKGFAEFKTKAQQFDELQEAQKTDLDKATGRAETAEAALAKYQMQEKVAAWKAAAAKASGVPVELLRGATEEEVNEHAESLKSHFKPDAAPSVQSDGFAPDPGASKSKKDLFASAIDNLM